MPSLGYLVDLSAPKACIALKICQTVTATGKSFFRMPLRDDRGTARPSRSQISSSLPASRLRRSRSPRPPRVDQSSSRTHRGYEHSSYTDIPLDAPKISKHDFKRFRSMFALYLEVQKQLDINELSDKEVMGRWKSFVGKW